MKIICWDIETAPLTVTSWGLYKPHLSHENIIEDSSIICAAWKVLGEAGVKTVAVKPAKPREDRALVCALREALSTADVIVAHNGDKFDLKHLNARLAHHNLAPLPPIKTVDTLKVARKYFRFTSNRLDYLGAYLGVGRKIPTSFGLWLDILKGDATALSRMLSYNQQDVRLLEKVYLKLRPFMAAHPNQRLVRGDKACPICGAKGQLQKRGFRLTRTARKQAFQCQSCAGWSTGEALALTRVA